MQCCHFDKESILQKVKLLFLVVLLFLVELLFLVDSTSKFLNVERENDGNNINSQVHIKIIWI